MLIMPRIKVGSYLRSSLEKNVYFCLFLEKMYEVSGFYLLTSPEVVDVNLAFRCVLFVTFESLGLYKVGLWFHFM